MSSLKIIGAARVKALIAMLNTQRDSEIAKVKATAMSQSEAKVETMKLLGAEKEYEKVAGLIIELAAASEELGAKTGLRYKANLSIDSYQASAYLKYNRTMSRLQTGGIDATIAKIKAEYAAKEQRLWLCETLEEAKAIVGVE